MTKNTNSWRRHIYWAKIFFTILSHSRTVGKNMLINIDKHSNRTKTDNKHCSRLNNNLAEFKPNFSWQHRHNAYLDRNAFCAWMTKDDIIDLLVTYHVFIASRQTRPVMIIFSVSLCAPASRLTGFPFRSLSSLFLTDFWVPSLSFWSRNDPCGFALQSSVNNTDSLTLTRFSRLYILKPNDYRN